MIQFIIGNDFSWPQFLFSFFYGLFIGLIIENTNSVKFYQRPFWYRNLLRISLLLISLFFLIYVLRLIYNGFVPEIELNGYKSYFSSLEFFQMVRGILIITFFIALFIELEKHLGSLFIWNFFLSKYKKPIEEERIIMFLDLKDSTQIAEKIGNRKFVEFINLCYSIMSKPVIKNKATILKYVGDEVILTWPVEKGSKFNRCIRFYFDYKEALENHKDEFETKFGFFPIFKAGLHSGKVIAAFLGSIKKQMDYSGDVMNTTARIQSVCNLYRANLLISNNLKEILPRNPTYVYTPIGDIELKGKEFKVGVESVELNKA